MGLLSNPAHVQRHRVRPWPRHQRRAWIRPDDVGGVTKLLAAIPSLPRAELSRLTERMIDRMDELDGDARDLSWSEWHTRWTKLSPAGHEAWDGEIVRATEDDEDTHDREQEERHA